MVSRVKVALTDKKIHCAFCSLDKEVAFPVYDGVPHIDSNKLCDHFKRNSGCFFTAGNGKNYWIELTRE